MGLTVGATCTLRRGRKGNEHVDVRSRNTLQENCERCMTWKAVEMAAGSSNHYHTILQTVVHISSHGKTNGRARAIIEKLQCYRLLWSNHACDGITSLLYCRCCMYNMHTELFSSIHRPPALSFAIPRPSKMSVRSGDEQHALLL